MDAACAWPGATRSHSLPRTRGRQATHGISAGRSCGLVVCEEIVEGFTIQPELVTAGLSLKDGAAVVVACADPYDT